MCPLCQIPPKRKCVFFFFFFRWLLEKTLFFKTQSQIPPAPHNRATCKAHHSFESPPPQQKRTSPFLRDAPTPSQQKLNQLNHSFLLAFLFCPVTNISNQTNPQPPAFFRAKSEEGTAFQWFMGNGILMMGFLIAVSSGQLERGLSPLVMLGGVPSTNALASDILWMVAKSS